MLSVMFRALEWHINLMKWAIGVLMLIVIFLVALLFYNHKKAQPPTITGEIIEISADNLLNPLTVGVKIDISANRPKKTGVIRETIEFELDHLYNREFIDHSKELTGKTLKFQRNRQACWTPEAIPITVSK